LFAKQQLNSVGPSSQTKSCPFVFQSLNVILQVARVNVLQNSVQKWGELRSDGRI
jgi:hypothetical protein